MGRTVLAAAACALALVPSAFALEAPWVDFGLNLGGAGLPSFRECAIAVAPGSSAADVMDQAQGNGCISSWVLTGHGVRCIDDLCSNAGWRLYLDELPPACACAFSNVRVQGGEVFEMVYADAGVSWPKVQSRLNDLNNS